MVVICVSICRPYDERESSRQEKAWEVRAKAEPKTQPKSTAWTGEEISEDTAAGQVARASASFAVLNPIISSHVTDDPTTFTSMLVLAQSLLWAI